jgi:hypothetical protein
VARLRCWAVASLLLLLLPCTGLRAAPTSPTAAQGMPPASGPSPQADTWLPPPSLSPPPGPDDQNKPAAETESPASAESQPAAPAPPTWRHMPLIELALAAGAGGGVTLVVVLIAYWTTRRHRGDNFSFGFFWSRIEARAIGAREFVEVDEVDPAQTLTSQAVLARGWSPELMEQVLGRADYAVLDPQRKREPLKLYSRDRVEKAEQGKEYQVFRAAVLDEKTRSEARIRKWLELRRMEAEEADAQRRR